jgi:hypothetical protein
MCCERQSNRGQELHVAHRPETTGVLSVALQSRILAESPARYPSAIELKIIASNPCSHPAVNLGTWITGVNHDIPMRIHPTLSYRVVQDAIPREMKMITSQIWFRAYTGRTSFKAILLSGIAEG